MIVIDTSLFIELARGGPRSKSAIQALGEESCGMTSITLHELLLGDEHVEEDLGDMALLSFDRTSARESSRIEKHLKGTETMINLGDILIAGICIANDATLVTFDKDFKNVKGLKVRVL